MIKVMNKRLPANENLELKQYQELINQEASYAKKVKRAKTEFELKNKKNNNTFKQIKSVLTEMCCGARRCMYCEDSVADEVEHFKPKDLYPEVVFSWSNYLYACGPCNSPKSSRFSILDKNLALIDVTRKANAAILPPPKGRVALIDPRHENPLDFLMLDLKNTFEFTPIDAPRTVNFNRADYTISTLHLNDRDYLIKARRNAFGGYCARLRDYIHSRDKGTNNLGLRLLREGIRHSPHPTVWAEMIRQRQHHANLLALFTAAPEALTF